MRKIVYRDVSEAEIAAFNAGVESVLYIRCTQHFKVPQYNENEAGGAECAACEVEKHKDMAEASHATLRAELEAERAKVEHVAADAAEAIVGVGIEAMARLRRAAMEERRLIVDWLKDEQQQEDYRGTPNILPDVAVRLEQGDHCAEVVSCTDPMVAELYRLRKELEAEQRSHAATLHTWKSATEKAEHERDESREAHKATALNLEHWRGVATKYAETLQAVTRGEVHSPDCREQKKGGGDCVRCQRDYWRQVSQGLGIEAFEAEKRFKAARLDHECSEAVLSMAVARLGGIVEGAPTGRHNFLQRIDQLVAMERGPL